MPGGGLRETRLRDAPAAVAPFQHESGACRQGISCPPIEIWNVPRASAHATSPEAEAPIGAPTQLNVAAETLGFGSVVLVTVRNLFFGKNEHIGYHKRHASVHVCTVQGGEDR